MHTFYKFLFFSLFLFRFVWMTVVVGADLLIFLAIVVSSVSFAILVLYWHEPIESFDTDAEHHFNNCAYNLKKSFWFHNENLNAKI